MKVRHHLVITFILIISLISNIKSINSSRHALQKVKDAESEIEKVKIDNVHLSDKIETLQSQEYLDKEAFEKFNLVKEGGTVLILDRGLPTSQQTATQPQPVQKKSWWQEFTNWLKELWPPFKKR